MILRILLVLLPLSLLFWWQARPLWKRRRKKEAVVCILLYGLGGLIGVLLILHVEIPSPTAPLLGWIEPFNHKLYGETERE